LTTLGQLVGDEEHTLTEAELPEVTVSGTSGSGGAHTHFIAGNDTGSGGSISNSNRFAKASSGPGDGQAYSASGVSAAATLGLTSEAAAHTHTFSDTFGSGDPHSIVQPGIG